MDGMVMTRIYRLASVHPHILDINGTTHIPIVRALRQGDAQACSEAIRTHILESRDLIFRTKDDYGVDAARPQQG